MTLVDNKGVVHLTDATEDMCFACIYAYARANNLGFYCTNLSCKDRKFSNLIRSSLLENGNIWVDYGSHSHFFEIQKTWHYTYSVV